MIAALVLIGAPGSGKSSVLGALGTQLEIDRQEYGSLETEQLSQGSPLLRAEDWIPQLGAVLNLQRKLGRRLFLIAATTEDAQELRGVVDAIAADRALIVCLRARPDTVAERIDRREPDGWPGKRRLISRARRLAVSVPTQDGVDLVIDTDHRDPVEVALEITKALARQGMLQGG